MKRISVFTQLLLTLSYGSFGQKLLDKQLDVLYKRSVPLIQPGQLALELTNKKIILLDTRTAAEYQVSHLAGARFINYASFSAKELNNLDLEAPIVVYCAVGVRSEKVGEQLLAAGYKNVRNLYGGIIKWKNQGQPVVSKPGLPTERVHTYNRYWSVWLTKGIKVYD